MKTPTFRQLIAKFNRITRAKERLHGIGVTCKHERILARMTNVRVRASRLDDATCHYQWRWYVQGNTYQFRELLKDMGFRWDPEFKGWWHVEVDVCTDFMCRACRQMSQAYRAA